MEEVAEYRRFLETRNETCRKIAESSRNLRKRSTNDEFLSIYESYLWSPNGLNGPNYSRKLPGMDKILVNKALPVQNESKSPVSA